MADLGVHNQWSLGCCQGWCNHDLQWITRSGGALNFSIVQGTTEIWGPRVHHYSNGSSLQLLPIWLRFVFPLPCHSSLEVWVAEPRFPLVPWPMGEARVCCRAVGPAYLKHWAVVSDSMDLIYALKHTHTVARKEMGLQANYRLEDADLLGKCRRKGTCNEKQRRERASAESPEQETGKEKETQTPLRRISSRPNSQRGGEEIDKRQRTTAENQSDGCEEVARGCRKSGNGNLREK